MGSQPSESTGGFSSQENFFLFCRTVLRGKIRKIVLSARRTFQADFLIFFQEIDSPNNTYRRLRGECYLNVKLFDPALTDLREAYVSTTDKEPVILLLRELILETGRIDETIKGEIYFAELQPFRECSVWVEHLITFNSEYPTFK